MENIARIISLEKLFDIKDKKKEIRWSNLASRNETKKLQQL